MVLNPDVKHKTQDEIARVCDPNQLPSLDDVDSLPYVTAVVVEVLRWSAIWVPFYRRLVRFKNQINSIHCRNQCLDKLPH